jgi:hypothetical protein
VRHAQCLLSVLLLPALASCERAATPSKLDDSMDVDVLRADLEYLASPELDGRVPGSAGDEAARAYVAERFEDLGLEMSSGTEGYAQPFVDSDGRATANVLGFLPGADEDVGDEMIVLSAHLDHLGNGRLGANGNASGVSALLAIAEALSAGAPLRRTVLFAAFGAEEAGFEGSAAFLASPPPDVDPSDLVYNVNLDMIGTYDQTGTVYALGSMPETYGRAVLDDLVDAYPELDVGLGDPSDLSDNATFCTVGVPYVFFWTDDPDCYHETCDTAERIDYASLASITGLTTDLVGALADTDEDLLITIDADADVCGT